MMAGSLADKNTDSANTICSIIKRFVFTHMTLKIGKVELMHVYKMT